MKQAGVDIIYDLTSIAVIGIIEVLANYRKFKQVFNMALDHIDQNRPDAVVLIDYPGFNLRLAAQIKKRNIPVIYYISPQVWAWAQGRAKKISQLVDRMMVIFEFEKDLYLQYGLECDFVGHPLLDTFKPEMNPQMLREKLDIPQENTIISLLPGSRKNEIKHILPTLLKTGQILYKHNPKTSFLLMSSPYVQEKTYLKILQDSDLPIIDPRQILRKDNITSDCLTISDLALVASGTATLETAISQTPLAVIYKIHPLSWPLLKLLVKLPFISLVNIVAKEKIVEEFLQYEATPENISKEALKILENDHYRNELKNNLQKVVQKLGSPGAARRAAEIIIKTIS